MQLKEYLPDFPFLAASFKAITETATRSAEIDARYLQLKERALEILELLPGVPSEFSEAIATISQPAQMADLIAQHIDLESQEKQEILETLDVKKRLDRMIELLGYRIEVLKLSQDIGRQTQEKLSAQQREHILRQQLHEIRRELGEANGLSAELAKLRADIEVSGMPEEARTHSLNTLARLEKIPESSVEYGVVQSYLDTLIHLPWKTGEPPEIDLEEARAILDADHFGLEKIKLRILEFLAVRKLNPEGKSPILCFVGPPGVGKTSLGRSIARAMGRKFARLSLGGVHDEAEIRGHRMTYIGAMPGNIIKTVQRAGVRDSVLLLDEIDKLGQSARGSPASALLEVLDPAQNDTFRDNYLNVPFDLSKIVFIATANVLDKIPGPLRDRMEVIEIAGYTLAEKIEIAKRYLVKRQLKSNGLKADQCRFNKAALRTIIEGYTREAGVRHLEREIGAIARQVAVSLVSGKTEGVSVTQKDVVNYLGQAKFHSEVALRTSIPGVATGLAWTPVGGDILFVEATKFEGTGKLVLTGQLGDVMRESAQAALSLVKARAEILQISSDVFKTEDLHIHVPAGAIPKDGPSAGVVIFLTLVSLFTDQCVRNDTAITGEISLRGLVLPVGGIKDKVIAAERAGVKRVCLPEDNRRNFEDIPESVRNRLEFIWLKTAEDAMRAALQPC